MTQFTPAEAKIIGQIADFVSDAESGNADADDCAESIFLYLKQQGWCPPAESTAMRAALEKLYKGLLSDPPSGPQKSILRDDVIYHLDGQLMYQAINAARAALATGAGVAEAIDWRTACGILLGNLRQLSADTEQSLDEDDEAIVADIEQQFKRTGARFGGAT